MRFTPVGRGRAAESRRSICRRGRKMSQRGYKVKNGADFTKREAVTLEINQA